MINTDYSEGATDIEYTETLATFTFRDLVSRVVIGYNPKANTWGMRYLLPGQNWDCAQANLSDVESREEIIKQGSSQSEARKVSCSSCALWQAHQRAHQSWSDDRLSSCGGGTLHTPADFSRQ